MTIISNGTWVQIVKPEDESLLKLIHIYWVKHMDQYNNKIYKISRYVTSQRSYRLDGVNYSWDSTWLKIVDVGQDGKPIPIDNEGRSSCYWCKVSTKVTEERCDKGTRIFTYCPKCGR